MQEEKVVLFNELNIKEKLSKNEALKLLYENHKDLDLNYKDIEGNRTLASLYKVFETIIELSGHGEYNFSKMQSAEILDIVSSVFKGLGYNTDILNFMEFIKHNKTNLYKRFIIYAFEEYKVNYIDIMV